MTTAGWIAWMLLSIPGAILFIAAICETIRDIRWRRAWKRGEIKPRPFIEHEKARYLSAPVLTESQPLGIANNAMEKRPIG